MNEEKRNQLIDAEIECESVECGSRNLSFDMSNYKTILYDSIQDACGHLPEGYVINLKMENGCGWVELTTSEGGQIEFDSTDMTLYQEIEHCIKLADQHNNT